MPLWSLLVVSTMRSASAQQQQQFSMEALKYASYRLGLRECRRIQLQARAKMLVLSLVPIPPPALVLALVQRKRKAQSEIARQAPARRRETEMGEWRRGSRLRGRARRCACREGCVTRMRRVHQTAAPSRNSAPPSKQWGSTVVGYAREVQHQRAMPPRPPKRQTGASHYLPLPLSLVARGAQRTLLARTGHRFSAWVRRCCSTRRSRRRR